MGDLHRLITGEFYPDSTVLLTARSEAKCFKSIPVLPRVKVTLLGTDNETVHRYMREAVSLTSDEEWKSFQVNYQEKLPDTSLLNIPLYLCILCAVFKDHIASGLKCTNLKIPESSTDLFNAFLHVVIKRWLDRTNRNQTVGFEKSPLDPNSIIPGDIKMILYFIGKLCYKDLTQLTSNYQFTDTEAHECFLDMQIIKDCGLFKLGKSGKHEYFYLKHKQLQEYLAALYLSLEGTREHTFHEILYHEKNKGQLLCDVIREFNVVRLVQFACGLAGEFLKSLLNIATSQFPLTVFRFTESMTPHISDIYYLAVLFTEHHPGDLSAVRPDDLQGFTELKQYLLNCKPCLTCSYGRVIESEFDAKCLCKLCGLFDKSLSLQLLSKFYDINVKPIDGQQSMNYEIEGQSGSEIWLELDQLQTELLNTVCIPSVQSVLSNKTHVYVDIPGLLQTFPHLTELNLDNEPYTPYCSKMRSDREIGTSLISVSLSGFEQETTLPESHVHALLQQRNLSSLNLQKKKNILHGLAHTTQPLWSNLQYLLLSCSCESDDSGAGMCRLLQSSKDSLTKCHLLNSVAVSTLPLIEEGLRSLKSVKDLSLVFRMHDDPYNLCDTLQRVLPHLTTLHTLRVLDVPNTLDRFVDTLCENTKHPNIRCLWLDGMFYKELPQQYKDKLTQNGVDVQLTECLSTGEICGISSSFMYNICL